LRIVDHALTEVNVKIVHRDLHTLGNVPHQRTEGIRREVFIEALHGRKFALDRFQNPLANINLAQTAHRFAAREGEQGGFARSTGPLGMN
jgi:hypothetical protein